MQRQLQVEEVAISKLKPFDKNPRTISPRGIEKLRKSIERFGFVNPVLAQKNTGVIIAGHQRIKAAKAEGLKTVPVIWLDMTDTEAKAYNIADNRLQDEAAWENGLLAGLITELDTEGFDLELTGLDDIEIKGVLSGIVHEGDYGTDFELPDGEKGNIETMTITLAHEQAELIKDAIRLVGEPQETFGNPNSNGNAIYEVARQWLAQRK